MLKHKRDNQFFFSDNYLIVLLVNLLNECFDEFLSNPKRNNIYRFLVGTTIRYSKIKFYLNCDSISLHQHLIYLEFYDKLIKLKESTDSVGIKWLQHSQVRKMLVFLISNRLAYSLRRMFLKMLMVDGISKILEILEFSFYSHLCIKTMLSLKANKPLRLRFICEY